MRFFALVMLLTAATAQAGPYDSLRDTTVRFSVGSGAIVKAKSGTKFALTNWHVCIPARVDGRVPVTYDNGRTFMGAIKAEDAKADLCLVTITDQDVPFLSIARDYRRGETVYTRGYPRGVLTEAEGVEIGRATYTYTFPIDELGECLPHMTKRYGISGRLAGCETQFKNGITNVYAQPGSSGSPVVNGRGELIGVMESYHPKQGGGMVPYEAVREFLEKH